MGGFEANRLPFATLFYPVISGLYPNGISDISLSIADITALITPISLQSQTKYAIHPPLPGLLFS